MVLKENKQALYFNMIMGTIGNILIAIATMRFLFKENDTVGYAIILFGFVLSIGYISYLEKQAGISKKFYWIRTIIIILSLLISALYFFNF